VITGMMKHFIFYICRISIVSFLYFNFSPFEVEIAIEKLKRYKLPGIDEIAAELIQAGGNILF
jgi:hypothetical protein